MKSPFVHALLVYFFKVVFIVILVWAVFRFAGPLPLAVNTRTLDKDSSFYVSADASTFVNPDTAVMVFAINTVATKAVDAKETANNTINKVTEEIKKLGVKNENIKTLNYNLYPNYTPDGRTITTYTVNVSIQVKEKDLDKVNKIIDTAVANGANQVSGITFDVENKDTVIDAARKEAIQKAKEKAQKIAGAAGIRLGRVLNVTEYYPSQYDFREKYAQGLGGENATSGTEIQPGQTEIKVNVTLTYETL